MRRATRVFALLAFGLAVFLATAELGLRAFGYSAPIWYQPDALLGWSMRPGTQGWFTREGRAFSQVNAAGFRDRERALAKPPGVYRIALIGDSAVEAFQVDLEQALGPQLQARLKSCARLEGRQPEVISFGVSGYGTAQETLLLESVAMRYQPDLVLLAFAANDVRNNSASLEPENLRPFFRPDGAGIRLDDSFISKPEFADRSLPLYEAYRASSDWLRLVQLVQAARNGINTLRQAWDAHAAAATPIPGIEPTTVTALFAPPRDPAWHEAWTVTERLLARMNAFSRDHHVQFAVATISHSAQVHPDPATRRNLERSLGVPDLFYVERRIAALGAREGFPVIALAPELQRHADAQKTYFHGFANYHLGWGHWNENGHRTAAALLASQLCPAL